MKKFAAWIISRPSIEFSRRTKNLDWLVLGDHSLPLCGWLKDFQRSFVCVSLTYQRVNIWTFLSALKGLLQGRPFSDQYLISTINAHCPKGVITLVDNKPQLWNLGNWFPNLQIVVIQNARRFSAYDVFGGLAHYEKPFGKVSNLFCYSPSVAELYLRYIDIEKVHFIGSYKNNEISVSHKSSMSKDIVWISSIESRRGNEFFLPTDSRYRELSYDEMNSSDDIALTNVIRYAKSHYLNLTIAGRSRKGFEAEEQDWYEQRVQGFKFNFVCREFWDSAYQLIDQAFVVATCDSTLGLESMVRGTKTIFLPYRERTTGDVSYRFGYPLSLEKAGPFWTANEDYESVEVLLDQIIGMSEHTWQQIVEKYSAMLMNVDWKNTQLKNIIRNV